MQTTELNEGIRKTLEDKFDQLATSLEELKSRVRETQHESRAMWEQQLAEPERQRRAAKTKLREFRSESSEAWDTFKSGMEDTWQNLKRTIEETGSKFKKS